MRKFFMTAFVLAAMVVFASSALALEKTPTRQIDERGDNWGAASTVTLAYYNICTGWTWLWGGWSPGEQLGTCFDASGCNSAVLNTAWVISRSSAPSGYGFTGTISVESACDCTGATLAAQPFLPVDGWNAYSWGTPVPSSFLLKVTWAAPTGFTNASQLRTDFGVAGPTGPVACGTCYPTTRVPNSFYYGVGGSACPGLGFYASGIGPVGAGCGLELLMDVALKCVVSVEDASWGQIKALYN